VRGGLRQEMEKVLCFLEHEAPLGFSLLLRGARRVQICNRPEAEAIECRVSSQ
jgi:hypothetical protein